MILHRSRTALALVLIAAVMVPFLMDDAEAPDADPGLVEEYGYADVIISEGARSSVHLTYRTADESGDGHVWTVRSVASGSSQILTYLTQLDGSLTVVMVGGSLGNLTLVQVDSVDGVSPVDVRFEMLGGSLADLRVLTVPYSLDSKLENSYTLMFGPLGDVDLRLESGSIGDLIPTEDMVSVDSLSVSIGQGAAVDRMLTTGSNGRYGSVHVSLEGGAVGYMTNVTSVVGTLEYDFEHGSVDYFCIGADSENGSNTYLSNLNTFYVQGDVRVTVDPTVVVRQAIVGTGILSVPFILWNGDSANATVSRNVEVAAPGMPLSPDSCFVSTARGSAAGTVFQFSNYTIGGSPRIKTMSSEFYYSGNADRGSIYGEDGVWPSATGMTVPSGIHLYLYAEMTVSSGTAVRVEPGGSLVNTGTIHLYGELSNLGSVTNSGLIDKRESGLVSGLDIEGDGTVAYRISLSTSDGVVNLMASSDYAVILAMDADMEVRLMNILLEGGDKVIDISAAETLHLSAGTVTIALRDIDGEDAEDAFRLTMDGLETAYSEGVSVQVTVPCTVLPDVECYVYHTDSSGERVAVDVVYRDAEVITFESVGPGDYFLTTDYHDLPQEEAMDEDFLNVVLAAVIAVVGAMVVYSLLRKD